MILYGSSMSPFVRKVLAFASEKGMALELQPVGLGDASPDFVAASPFRKMPGFKDGDFMISDSTAIITYLDTLQPEPNLIPLEAKARARTVWYEEFADTIATGCMAKVFFNKVVSPRFLGKPGDDEVAAKAQSDELPPIVDYLERIMPDSGFLVEDRLTLADLAVVSPFVNMSHTGWSVDPATHPKTAAFVEKILSRPSYAPVVAKERKFFERAA